MAILESAKDNEKIVADLTQKAERFLKRNSDNIDENEAAALIKDIEKEARRVEKECTKACDHDEEQRKFFADRVKAIKESFAPEIGALRGLARDLKQSLLDLAKERRRREIEAAEAERKKLEEAERRLEQETQVLANKTATELQELADQAQEAEAAREAYNQKIANASSIGSTGAKVSLAKRKKAKLIDFYAFCKWLKDNSYSEALEKIQQEAEKLALQIYRADGKLPEGTKIIEIESLR